MQGAELVEMMGPSGVPCTVVVFMLTCGLVLFSMSQLRATFGMEVSKQTTFNQMASFMASNPVRSPDVLATAQQRDFCKEHKIQGTTRTGKLKLVPLETLIGFCSFYTSTWGFLIPQLRVLDVARAPVNVSSATLTLTAEHLGTSHLATTPVHLQDAIEKEQYTTDDLRRQYGLQSVRPRWAIDQLKDFVAFVTTSFHYRREGQAVSEVTAKHFASNISSYIGFCATFRDVAVPPTLLVGSCFPRF